MIESGLNSDKQNKYNRLVRETKNWLKRRRNKLLTFKRGKQDYFGGQKWGGSNARRET